MATSPFIGQIQPFGFNFAPRGWALCQGQLLAISSNSALFALIGTTYGGDGRTSFGLPDLRGRAPIGVGNGPGLSNYVWGERGGQETVALIQAQMPSHSHAATATFRCSNQAGEEDSPEENYPAAHSGDENYASEATPDISMADDLGTVTVGNSGGSQAHENRMPYLAIFWCIALQGIFPSRN